MWNFVLEETFQNDRQVAQNMYLKCRNVASSGLILFREVWVWFLICNTTGALLKTLTDSYWLSCEWCGSHCKAIFVKYLKFSEKIYIIWYIWKNYNSTSFVFLSLKQIEDPSHVQCYFGTQTDLYESQKGQTTIVK